MIRKQKPVRIHKACETCRRHKVKCSGPPSCKYCEKYGDPCVFRNRYRESTNSFKQTLEIPDHVSVSVRNQESEFFGSASNFNFVNQLNHFLRQSGEGDDNNKPTEDMGSGLERFGLKPTVIEHSTANDFSIDDFTTPDVNAMIVAYLETWAVPFPFYDAEQVLRLAADAWKNPQAPAEDKALLYLIMSLGAATSYFDLEQSSSSAFPVSKSFFDLALSIVPNILSEVSFTAVRIVFLMSVATCCLGDTALSYLYIGIAVRISLAIGLHRDSGVSGTTYSLDRRLHRRVWACVWQFEQYWSFCVGRPSCISSNIGIPSISPDDLECDGLDNRLDPSNTSNEKYGLKGRFMMTSAHSFLRLQFASLLQKVHAELYNTTSDLSEVLSKVEQLSTEIDHVYFDSPDKVIIQSVIDGSANDLPIERVREWFWIRIYYLYIKLMIYRPILIFSAYTDAAKDRGDDNTKTPKSSTRPQSIQSKIKTGSDACVRTAIELSNFIIRLNKKVRMIQPIIFISTYLESTSTVLLFYILSSLADIPDPLAREIWQVLQDTRSFLNGSYGSYLESTQNLARDGLESLRTLLRSRDIHVGNTYLDRIIKPVMTGSPYNQIALDTDAAGGLESMWLQTLDWLDYAQR